MVWRQRPKCLGHLKSNTKAESLSLGPSSQHVAQPTAAATTADTADAIGQKNWIHGKIVVGCFCLFPTPDRPSGRCLSKQGMTVQEFRFTAGCSAEWTVDVWGDILYSAQQAGMRPGQDVRAVWRQLWSSFCRFHHIICRACGRTNTQSSAQDAFRRQETLI